MPVHPWQDRERYIRNSPWYFLDRVETPLLLLHGTDDAAAMVNFSNEIFLGLRRLGKTVEYARYVGEGHNFTSLDNRLDSGERYLQWFERYLKPKQ
jgi:dipeptidyl aminopeptidase/acylaminoacyl peptidase